MSEQYRKIDIESLSETGDQKFNLYVKSKDETQILAIGGLFHDLGLTAISDETLYKKGKLDMDEIQWMRSHTEEECQIIKGLKLYNEEIVKMAAHHHESFDGKSYPIPLRKTRFPIFREFAK